MNQETTLQQEASLKEARRSRRVLQAVFDSTEGRDALRILEMRFQTNLPVFQGCAGTFDPLDAMRRDAHREVFLYIRQQIQLALYEQHNEQES